MTDAAPPADAPEEPLSDDTPHVLVVDDDEAIRRLLARYLRKEGFLVSCAADAAEAEALRGGLTFDALIVDVMMPGEDGMSFTARVRALSDVPILMLTARGEARDRIGGLEAGADDYLAKPFEPRELSLRLRNLLTRTVRPGRAPEVRFGENRFDARRGELTRGGEVVRLTGAELTLLRALVAKPGAALPRAALAEKTGGSDRSVDVQVTRLRRKIEDDAKAPRHLQTVRGVGYVLVVD